MLFETDIINSYKHDEYCFDKILNDKGTISTEVNICFDSSKEEQNEDSTDHRQETYPYCTSQFVIILNNSKHKIFLQS